MPASPGTTDAGYVYFHRPYLQTFFQSSFTCNETVHCKWEYYFRVTYFEAKKGFAVQHSYEGCNEVPFLEGDVLKLNSTFARELSVEHAESRLQC